MTDLGHRRSIRLHGFDYSDNGAYFVTLCAAGRQCIFGRVEGREFVPGPLGKYRQARSGCEVPSLRP